VHRVAEVAGLGVGQRVGDQVKERIWALVSQLEGVVFVEI